MEEQETVAEAPAKISQAELMERMAEHMKVRKEREINEAHRTCVFYAPSRDMAEHYKLDSGWDYEYDKLFPFSSCTNKNIIGPIPVGACVNEGPQMPTCPGFTPEPIVTLRVIDVQRAEDGPPAEQAERLELQLVRRKWGWPVYSVVLTRLIDPHERTWSEPELLHTVNSEEGPDARMKAERLLKEELTAREEFKQQDVPPTRIEDPYLITVMADAS